MSSMEIIPGANNIAPIDINNKGQVVGYSYDIGAPFFWDNGTVSEIKSSVSGYVIYNTKALNDSGYVVGYATDTNSWANKAYIWRDGIMDILPLPSGTQQSFAVDINNRGEIVGDLIKNDGTYIHYGMIYRNGMTSDLNELIPDAARCQVNFANKINNLGSIVATGMINGETHAMLLTPPDDLNTGIRPEKTQATDHLLGQNFPNPFNYSTTIPYFLPEEEHVQLVIIDVLGREVAVLIDEVQLAGERSVEFNAEQLPGGVYFYRLQAGNYSETKRLLLLR